MVLPAACPPAPTHTQPHARGCTRCAGLELPRLFEQLVPLAEAGGVPLTDGVKGVLWQRLLAAEREDIVLCIPR